MAPPFRSLVEPEFTTILPPSNCETPTLTLKLPAVPLVADEETTARDPELPLFEVPLWSTIAPLVALPLKLFTVKAPLDVAKPVLKDTEPPCSGPTPAAITRRPPDP